jgi:hypothetical protein
MNDQVFNGKRFKLGLQESKKNCEDPKNPAPFFWRAQKKLFFCMTNRHFLAHLFSCVSKFAPLGI